jgi:hypothetical protein
MNTFHNFYLRKTKRDCGQQTPNDILVDLVTHVGLRQFSNALVFRGFWCKNKYYILILFEMTSINTKLLGRNDNAYNCTDASHLLSWEFKIFFRL